MNEIDHFMVSRYEKETDNTHWYIVSGYVDGLLYACRFLATDELAADADMFRVVCKDKLLEAAKL